MRTEGWRDLYHGLLETDIGPVGKHDARLQIEFRFPHDAGVVESVYLLCRYRRYNTTSLSGSGVFT